MVVLRLASTTCRARQEEQDFTFHPWALANGIECGGGKEAGRATEGLDGEGEWDSDDDRVEQGYKDPEVTHHTINRCLVAWPARACSA